MQKQIYFKNLFIILSFFLIDSSVHVAIVILFS